MPTSIRWAAACFDSLPEPPRYPGTNGPAAVMMAHLHQPPPRVTARRPDLPPELDAVIATAMAKEPAQRFRTAGELVDAAQNALRAAAPSVVRTTLPANAVGIPHVSDGGWWQPPGEPTPAETGPPPAPRRRLRWIAAAVAVVTTVAATVAAMTLTGREEPAAAPTTPTTPTSVAAPAPSTPALIPAGELPELLPSAQLLAVPLQTNGLTVESTATALLDSAPELSDPQCVSSWAPAQVAAYADTGYQAVQLQTLRDNAEPPQQTTVTQALIAFPTTAAAENAIGTQFEQWNQCANRAITVTPPGGGPTRVTLGDPTGGSATTHFIDQQREVRPAELPARDERQQQRRGGCRRLLPDRARPWPGGRRHHCRQPARPLRPVRSSAVTDGTPSIGSVIAGYRLERKLGEGGMGAVYLARNPDLPRYDAVKVLSAELSQSPEFRARFIREADLAARLTHPNVVAVYRRGETPDGQLWIAMQFIDGTDADAALRAHEMTAQRAVHVVTEVGRALDYAHGRNVVHRDIKPANFLFVPRREL